MEGRQIALNAERLGCDLEIRETSRNGDERRLTEDAVAEGWDVVVAAGGDGTIHGVANGILRAGNPDVQMGVLPIGTGNDYARLLRIPEHNVQEAMEILVTGSPRRIDVGFALDEYFVNALGFGFGPAVVQNMVEARAGFLPYLNAIVSTFWHFAPPYLETVTPDLAIGEKVMMVEVAIGTSVGGGMTLTPDADPCDGLADVCVISEVGTLKFLWYLPKVIRGRHVGRKEVRISRADRLEVRGEAGPITLHMDGELRQSQGPSVEIRILKQQLPVICAS